MDRKDTKNAIPPTDTPYSHMSSPDEYNPRDYGVSDDESLKITRLRALFNEGRYHELLDQQAEPTISGAVLNLYQAMSLLQLPGAEPGGGGRLRVLGYLTSALYILNSLPREEEVDYCRRLRVNIGVHIASAIKALTNDTYYPLAIVSASMDLAPDPRMGNWTAYVTAAEYEYDHGTEIGLAADAINDKVSDVLMSATASRAKFDTAKMEQYIERTVHFRDFRKSPNYSAFRKSLNKVKAQPTE